MVRNVRLEIYNNYTELVFLLLRIMHPLSLISCPRVCDVLLLPLINLSARGQVVTPVTCELGSDVELLSVENLLLHIRNRNIPTKYHYPFGVV